MEPMRQRLHLIAAATFGLAGLGHFTRADFFEAVVPDWMPSPALVNQVSGAAEITLAAGLIPARTRRVSGWGLLALLALVFPANVDMAINDVAVVKDLDGQWERRPGEVADARNWIRLPFQLLFAWLVYRGAGLGSRRD
jgi:uncharacterized membrane protein